jgi:hypothetical protein
MIGFNDNRIIVKAAVADDGDICPTSLDNLFLFRQGDSASQLKIVELSEGVERELITVTIDPK